MLTDFDRSLCVAFYDVGTGGYRVEEYAPGQDVIIPEFKVHWLMNQHDSDLNFTCYLAIGPQFVILVGVITRMYLLHTPSSIE